MEAFQKTVINGVAFIVSSYIIDFFSSEVNTMRRYLFVQRLCSIHSCKYIDRQVVLKCELLLLFVSALLVVLLNCCSTEVTYLLCFL